MANHPCDSVLVREFTYEEEIEATAIAYLDLIGREDFEQNRQTVITNANVIYGGTPMSGEGNYEEFNARRERYFQEKRYSSNKSRARTVVSQKVSPEAIAEWGRCMGQQIGFSCWVEEADENSVRVFFKWNPPAGVLDGRVTVSTLLGGRSPVANTPAGAVLPVEYVFQPGAAFPLIFTRNSPEEDFELNVVLNDGFGFGLELPGIIEVSPPRDSINFQTNELNFAATSGGNPAQTITFSPLFQSPPVMYAAICGVAVLGGQGQNYRIAFEDVTTHSATIRVRSGGSPTPGLQVRWLALEAVSTPPFRTEDLSFEAAPAGNPVQTITFSPSFQSPPTVYTAVDGTVVSGGQVQNYRTAVEDVTIHGANIRVRSGGEPSPRLHVRWLAIQESSTLPFQTDEFRFEAAPSGDSALTITFPLPFQRPPAVYTAVCGMVVHSNQHQNYRIDVEAVDTHSARIRLRSAGEPTPAVHVRWLALAGC